MMSEKIIRLKQLSLNRAAVIVGMQIFTPKYEDSFVANFSEVFHECYLFCRYFISFSVSANREVALKGQKRHSLLLLLLFAQVQSREIRY
jgi:hypothetical protein